MHVDLQMGPDLHKKSAITTSASTLYHLVEKGRSDLPGVGDFERSSDTMRISRPPSVNSFYRFIASPPPLQIAAVGTRSRGKSCSRNPRFCNDYGLCTSSPSRYRSGGSTKPLRNSRLSLLTNDSEHHPLLHPFLSVSGR